MSDELLVLSLLGGVVALWGAQLLRAWWGNLRQPEQSETAMVLEKALVQEKGGGWEPDQHYLVTFSLLDGGRRRFVVTKGQYQALHAGQKGQLHTQGSWFRSFEIN